MFKFRKCKHGTRKKWMLDKGREHIVNRFSEKAEKEEPQIIDEKCGFPYQRDNINLLLWATFRVVCGTRPRN